MSKRKTNDEFILESKKINGDRYSYSLTEYKNNNTKVKIVCPEHGEFEVRPNDHLSKNVSCNKCNNAGISKKNNLGKVIIEKFNAKHKKKYDYSLVEYKGTDINVKIICTEHGEFEQTPHHHLNGHGCPECKNVKPLTNESFVNKANEINGNLYDYSLVDYKNNSTSVNIICRKHGVFKQTPNCHLSMKTGCPICKESNGESIIREFLNENNISFIHQRRFNDCRDKNPLPFDFYLPDLNSCIEYDGEQHFKVIGHWGGKNGLLDRQRKDKIKTEYCEEKDIKLIRIKYNDNIQYKLKQIKWKH